MLIKCCQENFTHNDKIGVRLSHSDGSQFQKAKMVSDKLKLGSALGSMASNKCTVLTLSKTSFGDP